MNLKVSVKDLNSCEKLLTIDVPQEEVEAEYNLFFEAASKRAKIPGFRPGHAPKNIVARHFKSEARDEVLRNLLSRSFQEATREKSISPISYPKINDVEFDDLHLKFNAHVELRPSIKIDKYTGLQLKREIAAVEDKEIEEVLKRIQDSHAKFQPVEDRSAELGDFLVCDYRLEVDGKEIEKRAGEWFQIREKDFLDGFSKQLIGVKPADQKEVVVKFPENYTKKEMAGKEGHFFVTVSEIKAKVLPALDDDLAREASTYQTFAEFKDSIRKDLGTHKREDAEVKLENGLFEELIKKSRFEVPTGMVERRLRSLAEEQTNQMLSYGMKEEDVKAQLEKAKDNLRSEAEKQIRLSFILDEIAVKENVKVEESDLEAKYQSTAERVRRSVDEVKSYYQEKQERLESLAAQVLNEKVIQLIKDKAIIQEIPQAKEGGK